MFTCSNRVFTRKAASYSYIFGYPYDKVDSLSCPDHACHADEIPYVFESFWDRFTDIGRYISQGMVTYWTNFAKSENPNETYTFIQNPFQLGHNYVKDDCDFWDQMGYK